MIRNRKLKFRIKTKPVTRSISPRLDKLIKRKIKDMQRKENIEYGRKAQHVTYQFATQELARIMEGLER